MVRHAGARCGRSPARRQQPEPPGRELPAHPYYAIGCTLEAIQAESVDDRMSLKVFGQSALGRPMYLVTINSLETPDQRRDFGRWSKLRAAGRASTATASTSTGTS